MATLNRAINAVMAQQGVQQTLRKQAMDIVSDSTPQSSAAFLRAEIEKWEALIARAGIKAS
ncbi:hypothetical protein [Teichococcus aestuarii]|uniref:hypothetical protein n=1 Tax=Teichococcus aestuarii TaxID=568898 RepID=UPI00361244CC